MSPFPALTRPFEDCGALGFSFLEVTMALAAAIVARPLKFLTIFDKFSPSTSVKQRVKIMLIVFTVVNIECNCFMNTVRARIDHRP